MRATLRAGTKPLAHLVAASLTIGKDVWHGCSLGIGRSGDVCQLDLSVIIDHSTFGFATALVGEQHRAAQGAGLPVGRLILIVCLLAGGAAGLSGALEVAAVHKQANASLIVGYGFTGILVSFIARHHPLGILPAALMFGGLSSSLVGAPANIWKLPDASIGSSLKGIIFVMNSTLGNVCRPVPGIFPTAGCHDRRLTKRKSSDHRAVGEGGDVDEWLNQRSGRVWWRGHRRASSEWLSRRTPYLYVSMGECVTEERAGSTSGWKARWSWGP